MTPRTPCARHIYCHHWIGLAAALRLPWAVLVVAAVACGRRPEAGLVSASIVTFRCAQGAGDSNSTADLMTLKDTVWDEGGDGHRWYLSELPDMRTGAYQADGYQLGFVRPPGTGPAVGGILGGDRREMPDTFEVQWGGPARDSIRLRRVSSTAPSPSFAIDSFAGVVACDSLWGRFWEPGGKVADSMFVHWWMQ